MCNLGALEIFKVPRQRCNFRQSDLTRALKGARAAGIGISRFEIDKDGKIIVVIGKPTEAPEPNSTECNEWDDVQ